MKYKMFSKVAIGPDHSDEGLPCQDSVGEENFGDTLIIVTADGHGDKKCFRSEIGSKFAVEAAICQTEKFCGTAPTLDEDGSAITISETQITTFKFAIWQDWKKRVKDHWDGYFIEEDKLCDKEKRYSEVSDEDKERYTSKDNDVVERRLYTAYGTTLLVAVKFGQQLLLLQVGDGTCAVLHQDGTFSVPIPTDERIFLNMTTSLSDEDAFLEIRHAVIDCDTNSPKCPVAVFLSSDGVDNYYPLNENEKHLYKLYAVIIGSILAVGFEATVDGIGNDVLPHLKTGSRDDISLAGFVCEDDVLLKDVSNKIDEQYKPKMRQNEQDGSPTYS
jgi:hypothetical protein